MERSEAWTGPLMISGASRSGTAMLRSIFNRHSRIHLAGETHYFDDLRMRSHLPKSGALTAGQQNECADYFRSIDVRPYGMRGDPDASGISRAELIEGAALRGGGVDGYFEAYCRLVTARAERTIWGEKTPRHVFRIEEIIAAFPDAKIITMVRDPRAVVASYRDWRNQGGLNKRNEADYTEAIRAEERRAQISYNIVIATLLWRATFNAALAAVKAFGPDRVRIVHYEDIVDRPDETVAALCDWLGIEFEPAMMNVPVHNSSVIPFSEGAGVTTAAAQRWRKALSEREIGVIQAVAGTALRDAGYDILPIANARVHLAAELAKLPFATTRVLLANRDRMGNAFAYSWRRVRLLAGRQRPVPAAARPAVSASAGRAATRRD